jgi:hypothetical protein
MRILRTVAITVLALCLAILTEAHGPSTSRTLKTNAANLQRVPRAVIPFNTFDFGDVYTGDLISQIFVIKNTGDADLQITDFKGECGCTAVRSEKVIPPGQEGIAQVEVQTASQSGGITKIATMHTNDPDQPNIVFALVANVLKGAPLRQGKYIGPIFLSPDSRVGMFSMPGKKTTAEFSITADQAPVKLLRAEAGTKNFVTRIIELEAGRSYKIQVESLPIEKGGFYTDQIRIVTDHPALPPFKIDLALRIYDVQ